MSDSGQIGIFLNGEKRTISAELGISALIANLGLPVQGVLIEHNGSALFHAEWLGIRLADGDRLEILRVVAGG